MDPLDCTLNNCSFASGRSVSLNSSVCCSPTIGAIRPTTTTFTATNAMGDSHRSRSRYAPPSVSRGGTNNKPHRGYGNGATASDRFVAHGDQSLEEEGTRAVDALASTWGGADWGSERRSLTFSPTRSDMAASFALRTPPYHQGGGRGVAAAAEESDDDDLGNTARSIFGSPQGQGRASTGGMDNLLPRSSQPQHRPLQVPSAIQNPLLDMYALEASHQEWTSAVAAANTSGPRLNMTDMSPSSSTAATAVSSPLMGGTFGLRDNHNNTGTGTQRRREEELASANHTTASDYIRASEDAASANASPHATSSSQINSPGSVAAQAFRSLASGESPGAYLSSLADVLLPTGTSPSSTTKKGAQKKRQNSDSEIGIQSPQSLVIKRGGGGSSAMANTTSSSHRHEENSFNPPTTTTASNPSQASVFDSSDALTYRRNKVRHFQTSTFRTIPQTPERILDAPELVDDFYLNLLDWSSKNVLTVALSNTCYLWNAANGSITQLMTTNVHDNVITAVGWQAAGDVLAIGLSSGEIKVWNTKTEKCLHTITSHTGRVCSLSWHGYLLASGSRDTSIIVHNLQGIVETDMLQQQQQSGSAGQLSSSSSSSASYLASSSLQAFAGAGLVLQGHTQEVCGLAWSPDGTQLASGGNDNNLCIWNVSKSPTALDISLGWQFSEHTAAIKAIAWNPTRPHCLATGGGTADKTLRIWNTLTGERTHLVDTKSQVCGIVWNNDGTEFVSSHGFSDNQLTIWRFPTMKKLADLTGHTSRVLHLAKSPDGEMVVSAAGDETIRFWRCFAPAAGAAPSKKISEAAVAAEAEGDNEKETQEQHASEVAAIVAAVQRDVVWQQTASRKSACHFSKMTGSGNGSPTPTTTFPSVQRPHQSNTASKMFCAPPPPLTYSATNYDSVENELLCLTEDGTVPDAAVVSSLATSTSRQHHRLSGSYNNNNQNNNSKLSNSNNHIDPLATTTTSIIGGYAVDAERSAYLVSPQQIQRGSSPLSQISSISPIQSGSGVTFPHATTAATVPPRTASPLLDSSWGGMMARGGSLDSKYTSGAASPVRHQSQPRNRCDTTMSSWDAPSLFGDGSLLMGGGCSSTGRFGQVQPSGKVGGAMGGFTSSSTFGAGSCR